MVQITNPAYLELRQAIENLIQVVGTATGTTTINNGSSAVFTITTTSTSGAVPLVIHDWSLFLTSQSSANQFPAGSNINMSQWVVYTFINDWGDENVANTNVKMQIYVANNTGSQQTVILKEQARIIQNSITTGGTLG